MITRRILTFSGSDFRIQLLLTSVGTIGILAMFLPFAWDISPLNAALYKELWRLAWPFFLPVLVTSTSARWLITKKLSRLESMIAYLTSGAMVCLTLSVYVTADRWPEAFNEWLGFVFPFVTLVFGIFILMRTRRKLVLESLGAVVSLQVAFLANCLLCLSSFFGHWQIGAYCFLVTALVYSIQIVLVWANDAPPADVQVP